MKIKKILLIFLLILTSSASLAQKTTLDSVCAKPVALKNPNIRLYDVSDRCYHVYVKPRFWQSTTPI